MQNVTFTNAGVTMAGNLHLPDGFSEDRSYPAIVSVHPGGGVKEQTAGLYAEKLAREGFVTLAFDASHQGESGGQPRHLEDHASRVEDVRAAVDYLSTLSYVDAGRIGVLGICAGAGYAVNATMTDRRIKAVGTISPIDIGAAYRLGWDGTEPVARQLATLDAVAQQRAAEAAGADAVIVPYVPETVDETTVPDMAEAHDYYRTPRAKHPRSDNRMLFTSIANVYAFDAFHQVETLLTQPLLMVAGSKAGSLWQAEQLLPRVNSPKELAIVDGAGHVSLYDIPEYVDQPTAHLSPFFTKYL
ncbi:MULTISPECIES: alpha/beta hydrolase [Streptomyces]|uniref:alpha/beta hydrolase n=1 Tax=Streptomyces TaxID=1883 RepID=UPI0011652B35|nr:MULTISPECIES: alpha/beta hydrolase [Streptomyces]MCX4615605.1 alpha/beta hydrolase [Streptomyces mirabilis]MCX5356132.1 alpha/beta hydrolase [Streptomyces mirabilis]QDN84601.1 alpha/beta hydrolase [Streptomyces sp. RLB3-6]QDO05463.1 alpha/beta hydrolase [Streptomyces sp. S1D4-23]